MNPTELTAPGDAHADLTSHDTFAQGVPHATFERLRRDDPVCWIERGEGLGFWAVTRHEDVITINRDHARFSSAHGIRIEDQTADEVEARRTFQETDPPVHTRARLHLNRAFSKKIIAAYEEQVREIAIEILDEALAQREFDAVKMIARKLPMRILGRVLGLPDEDLDWLVDKGDALIANTDPDFTDHVIDQVNTDEYRFYPFRSPAGKDLYDYAEKQAALRRDQNTDDLLSLFLAPMKNGETFSDLEFKNAFALLVSAGNDTTRYSITSSIKAMIDHPELLDTFRTLDEAQWLSAVEEMLRWASPTMYFRRTATEDVDYKGHHIKQGDKVVLWFVSANRDQAVFADPFQINIGRDPNPHLAFGQGGVHACLGMWLARLELRVVLKELVKRISSIEQTTTETFLRSNFIGGIKSLPVAVKIK
jgi:cytochrome P450